jgi:magnesium transporter
MVRTLRGRNITWYDVEMPTREDVAKLSDELAIHPLVLDELIPQVRHPKLDIFSTHLFLVLTIPMVKQSRNDHEPIVQLEELDIIFSTSWVVTSHYHSLEIIDELFRELSKKRNEHIEYLDDERPTTLLYTILSTLLRNFISSLGTIEERVDRIEVALSGEISPSMIRDLSELRHEIIDFRRALSPARPVFRALDDAAPALLGPNATPYFRNLTGRIEQIATLLKTLKETVEALENTNQTLLTTRTNDIMKLFTVLTAVFLIPSLITSIFSMNLPYPFRISDSSFWWVTILSFVLLIPPILYFRKRKWL